MNCSRLFVAACALAGASGGQGKGHARADPFFRAKSTALIGDETIKFLKANREKLLYVNVWTLLPHAPLKPTPEQLKPYENLVARSDDPAFGPWMQKYLAASKDLNSQRKVFCDMKGGKAELYDIPNDLSELKDVAANHPDIVRALTAEMLAWQQTLPASPLRDQAANGIKTPTPSRTGKGKKKMA